MLNHAESFALRRYELNDAERAWLLAQPGCALLAVATSPGDLLLWDSRTIHCGRRAAAPQPPHTSWRLALFVAMWPAARLDAAARAAKAAALGVRADGSGRFVQDATLRCESTSHWPDGRELKPRYGWPEEAEVDAVDAWSRPRPAAARSVGICVAPPVALSRDALRLAGVLPYDSESESGSEEEAGPLDRAAAASE